jgi:hypothetical protein
VYPVFTGRALDAVGSASLPTQPTWVLGQLGTVGWFGSEINKVG